MNVDEFEIEYGDRLRSIGFNDSRLVFETAIETRIPLDKAVDALVESSSPKDLGSYFRLVLEDIGLLSWNLFLQKLVQQ